MLKIQPAKAMQGKLELPSSPDLFVVAVMASIAAQRSTRIQNVQETPLLKSWCEALSGHADISFEGDVCHVTPSDDPSAFLVLPGNELPYRDLVLFIALGMGKVVAFRSVSQSRIQSWIAQGKRLGIKIVESQHGEYQGLAISEFPENAVEQIVDENDVSAMLGFISGSRKSMSFQIDYQLSHPMRHFAPLLGHEFSVKNAIPVKHDPLARRIQLMQAKKRTAPAGQLFTVHLDCTQKSEQPETAEIQLPGDEILSAILLAAKCILPRGSLIISNAPLEPWATQLFSFVRKMGGKLSVQETHRSSFGSVGIVSFQKIELTGKKIECIPLYQFRDQLPAMIVVAAFAEAQSVFRALEDLRMDEPDGIDTIESCIRLLGARHGEMPDGVVMEGKRDFDGFDVKDILPAPLAGALAAAGLRCLGTTSLDDSDIRRRWPAFDSILGSICEFRSQQTPSE